MSELTLEQKLAFLESEMAAIKEQIQQKKKPKVDESYIGHVVEVSDQGIEWRERILHNINRKANFPFKSAQRASYKKCRPRTKGPSVGHWIWHDGTGIPIDPQELVVIEHSDDEFYTGRALGYDWKYVKRYAIIKVG